MMKKTKYIWYVIGISILIVFSLILLSSVLDVGQRLRSISIYLEVLFYVLIVIIIFFGIVNPIRIIVSSPSLSIATSLDPKDDKVYKIYKNVAKNIVKNNNLPEDSKELLVNYHTKEELIINLQYIFEIDVKKQLNKLVITHAKTVMISTAICQSARFDMLTVFTINLQMIKALVLKCGFRPSMKNLSKLTLNVFSTALIAEGLENIGIEEILPQSSMNAISEIPLIKPLLNSVMQGVANSLLTIRIGCVTRRYLFSDGAVITKGDIRREALKESAKLLPLVVAETVTFFPKKIVKFFSGKKKEQTQEV